MGRIEQVDRHGNTPGTVEGVKYDVPRRSPKATLYWHPTGPLLSYAERTFLIEDLNPTARIAWRMSRWELFKLGCRCVWRSAWPA